ncbi:MAG: hypothetical protein FJY60_04955 [Betaproteobacteria bacterium]|nr:hypothetical protein [Betaproteobacteria bacterium]
MSFSNIQAVQKTTSAQGVNGRARLLGVYFTHTATPATLLLKTGGSGGTTKLALTTPASAGSQDLVIPNIGILFDDGIYIAISSAEITSVTLLFEGGAAA